MSNSLVKGIIFIVSAPSGTGKTTLCRKAVDFFPNLRHSISYTTRSPRPGEINGVDYWFVDDAAFDRMVENDEFLEYASVFGRRYGTSRKDLEEMLSGGLDVILDIDVQGAEKARKRLNNGVYVFILPPSIEACEERLRSRGKDRPEEIKKRLKISLDEIKNAPLYEYIIINDVLDSAFEKLKSIIISERSKTKRMLSSIREIFAGIID
jgi:guanylate kinase